MTPRLDSALVCGGLVAAALLAGGCSTTEPAVVSIAAGDYARTFDTARDVLRDERYALERVDAAAGVITTQRSSAVQDAWDIMQRRQRTIRVTAVDSGGKPIDPASQDAGNTAKTLKVTAILERIEAPGWRVSNASVQIARRTSDPDLVAKDLEPVYAVEVGQDEPLARRLALLIRERLASGAAAARSPVR